MRTLHKIIIAIGAICIAGLVTFSAQAFSLQPWLTQTSLESSSAIKLDSNVALDFSFPVIPSVVEKNIAISPRVPVSFSWENNNKRLLISPETHWQAGTDYTISIQGGKNILYSSFDSNLAFSTEKMPEVDSIVPISGEKNIDVTMQDPITVNFTAPLDDYAVNFIVSPQENLTYQMSTDKKSIKLLATNDFKYSTDYDVQVFLKYKSDDQNAFQKAGETTFATAAAPVPVITTWASDFATRLAQAKQFTPAQITTGKYIDVNLKEQVMVTFQDGQPLDSYMISSGERGFQTPTGKFQIYNKSPRAWSAQYGLWMPWWMAFLPDGEMGIHELPIGPNGYQEGVGHLGTPVSHGCVRLGDGPAKTVYDWADIGTPVIIHY